MRSMIALAFAALSLLSVHPSHAQGEPGPAIPGRFIISLDLGEDPRQVARDHGVTPEFVYQRALVGFAGRMSDAARAGLLRDARVRRVEPDRVVRATGELVSLGGPLAPTITWALDRIDQRLLPLDGQYNATITASNVTAYIIDTGIRYDHVEFGGRARFGYDAFGGNGADCNGHGTHVAGSVGSTTYGVAKGVQLVAVRVLDCNGSGTMSGVIAGVDWVAQNRALPAVANLSLGGPATSSLDTAIANLTASGVSVSVAAGNDNTDACNVSPARAPSAITVGASGNNDARASFSNWGACVDWFAPGVNITSSYYSASNALATMSGTSMASPHVAGAAALYLSGNPGASPDQVRNALYADATKGVITASNRANNHLLYVLGVPGNPTPTPAPSPTPTPVPGDSTPPSVSLTAPANGAVVARRSTVTLSATASDNVGVARVEFYVNGSLACSDTSAPYSCGWNVPNAPRRAYTISARAYDTAGNAASSGSVSISSN